MSGVVGLLLGAQNTFFSPFYRSKQPFFAKVFSKAVQNYEIIFIFAVHSVTKLF